MFTRQQIKRICLTATALTCVAFAIPASAQQEDKPLHPSLSVSLKQAVATGIATNPEYGEVAANLDRTRGRLPLADVGSGGFVLAAGCAAVEDELSDARGALLLLLLLLRLG